jgi:hypothetical protein
MVWRFWRRETSCLWLDLNPRLRFELQKQFEEKGEKEPSLYIPSVGRVWENTA